MLTSKKTSFLLQLLLVLWLLVFSAECEKPVTHAGHHPSLKTHPSKTQPGKAKADKAGIDKAVGSPFAGQGQPIQIIKSQRYQELERAFGRELHVGEHVAASSERKSSSSQHQRLVEGVIVAPQSCEQEGDIWKTVMRPDWHATFWDMLVMDATTGSCIIRGGSWAVRGDSLTKLGTVRPNVDVEAEARTIQKQNPCYSLTTNNCRHFVALLWDRIKLVDGHDTTELKTKKLKREIIDEEIEELLIRDFGFDARELFLLDDLLFSRMIQLEDSIDDELEYETRSLLADEWMEVLQARKVPQQTYVQYKDEPTIVRGHVDLGAVKQCATKNPDKNVGLDPVTTTSSSSSTPSATPPPSSPGAGCSSTTGQCDHDCGEAGYDKTACSILAGLGYSNGLCFCNKPCQSISCRLTVPGLAAKKEKKTQETQETPHEKQPQPAKNGRQGNKEQHKKKTPKHSEKGKK